MVKVCFTRYVPSSGSRCCYFCLQYSGSLQFCTSHRFSSYNLRCNRPFTLFLYPSVLICSTIRYSEQNKCKGKQIFIRHTNRYYSTARFTGNSGQTTILLGPVIPPSPQQGEILQDNINIDVFWVTSIILLYLKVPIPSAFCANFIINPKIVIVLYWFSTAVFFLFMLIK